MTGSDVEHRRSHAEIHLRDRWRVRLAETLGGGDRFPVVSWASSGFTASSSPPVYEAIATVEVAASGAPPRPRPGRQRHRRGEATAGSPRKNTRTRRSRSSGPSGRGSERSRRSASRTTRVSPTRKDPVGVLRAMIRAVPRRETGLIEISMRSGRPRRCRPLRQHLRRPFVARNLQRAKRQRRPKRYDAITSHDGSARRERLTEAEDKRFERPETDRELQPGDAARDHASAPLEAQRGAERDSSWRSAA